MDRVLKLKPVGSSFTLKDHIADVLRDAILKADIYHEDADLKLDERQLAEELGISRTPIREALTRLEQQGMVRIVARKGVFIVRKSLNEILEMIIAWAALESMAARLATENASDAELASLRRLAARFSGNEASAQIAEYSEANITFHQRILELSKVPLLKTMADDLFRHMHAVRRRALGEGNRAQRSVVDHLEIIEALEARDAELASRLVREHTMKLHDHIRRVWTRLEIDQRRKTAAGE